MEITLQENMNSATKDGIVSRVAKLMRQRNLYMVDHPRSYSGFYWQQAFEVEMGYAGKDAVQLYLEAKSQVPARIF